MLFKIVWSLLLRILELVNKHLNIHLSNNNLRIGSTMFAGISRLLKFLKKSFQIQSSRHRASSSNNQDEHQFQTAVINGIGKTISERKEFIFLEFNRRFFGEVTRFSNDGNNAVYYHIITNT
jgi:hypothetical protein